MVQGQETLAQADSAWARGDHDTAYELYENVLDRDSTDVTALHRVALVLSWRGSYDQSLTLLDRASGEAPDYTPAQVDKARVLGLAAQYDDALRTIDAVLAAEPYNESALDVKATVAFWAGRLEMSADTYGQLVRVARDPGPFLLPYARVLVAAGRHQEAEPVVDRILAGDPGSLEALDLRAQIRLATDRTEQALEDYRRLARSSPDPSPYYFPQARLLADLGRYDEAVDAVDQALRASPDDVGLLDAKARWASRVEDFGTAAEAYGRLYELTQDPAYRLERAQVLAWDERYDASLAEVDAVLAERPGNVEALQAKARYASWAEDYGQALGAYETLLERFPGSSEYLLARGQVLMSMEDYGAAAAAFEATLEADPDNLEAMVGLGQALAWTDRFDSAQAVYSRGLQSYPDDARLARGLAQATTWEGALREAEGQWRDAVERHPSDAQAWMGLASNLRFQQRYRASEEAYLEARTLDPDLPTVEEELDLARRGRAPSIAPTYTFVTDSDDNENHTFDVVGTAYVSDAFQLSVSGAHASLKQTSGARPEQTVNSGSFGATVRFPSGWAIRGNVGVWQPDTDGVDATATGGAGLSSPVWGRVQANFNYARSVYDVTALVAQSRVDVDEFGIDGRVRFSDDVYLFANGSRAELSGTEDNTRTLGGVRLNVVALPWLTLGAAGRAMAFEDDVDDGYWDPESFLLLEAPVLIGPTTGAFRPSLEVSPGYQRDESQPDEDDLWNASIRLQGRLAYDFGPRRQIGISALFANAGTQQIAETADDEYRFGSVSVFFSWAF